MDSVAVYSYTGVLKSGDRAKGMVAALGPDHAYNLLVKRGIYPTRIKKVPKWRYAYFPVSYSQHVLFFSSLARLLSSGVPLLQALDSIADEQPHPRYAVAMRLLKQSIEEGLTFAEGLERINFWDGAVIGVVKAGERAGQLEDVLRELANYFRERERISKSVRQALVYPIFIGIFLTGIVFYAPRVFDKLMNFYSKFPKAEFPVFSLLVIGGLRKLALFLPVILVGLILMLLGIITLRKRNQKFRLFIDGMLLKLPVVGRFILVVSEYQSMVAMKVLLKSGLSLDYVVENIAGIQANEVVRRAWLVVLDEVKRGASFSDALKANRYLSGFIKTLISVGEESGKLDEQLEEASKYMEEVFQGLVAFISSTVGPVVLAVAGVIVGVILIAIYLPLLNMPQLLGHLH